MIKYTTCYLLMLIAFTVIVFDTAHATTTTRTYNYQYDAAGRLVEVNNGDKYRFIYTYDAAGNLLHRENGPTDISGNGVTDLADLIIVLKIITGQTPSATFNKQDINGDGKLGLEEGLQVLREISQE